MPIPIAVIGDPYLMLIPDISIIDLAIITKIPSVYQLGRIAGKIRGPPPFMP